MKIAIILTQYKRGHIEQQLIALQNQTLNVDTIVVFQNEMHVDIEHLKNKYNFKHVRSDINTKYFGRFAFGFSLDADIIIVMDDDIIPGKNFVKNFTEQCVQYNGIIGGNGRIATLNKNETLSQPSDTCFTQQPVKVDFVGHAWCIKKEWLHYMFSITPLTYDTGEDMHLCFSCKLLGGINSYMAKQSSLADHCDTTCNRLASDKFASFKTTSKESRTAVERHFNEKYNLDFITDQNN
jgi:hypothetical protein